MDLGIERAETTCSTHITRLPDGAATLVARQQTGTARMEVFVVGPLSRALFKTVSPSPAHSIRVRVGYVRRAFGVPASELLNEIIDAQVLWGDVARRLEDDLVRAKPVHRCSILKRTLVQRVCSTPEPAAAMLARRALDIISASKTCRVDELANHVGVSGRHLRRIFSDIVGFSPKTVARMLRMQRVIMHGSTTGSWADIAAEHGYYDQAHLIAESHALLGMTPMAYESLEIDDGAPDDACI